MMFIILLIFCLLTGHAFSVQPSIDTQQEESSQECCICANTLPSDEPMVCLHSMHFLHVVCLAEYLRTNHVSASSARGMPLCPMCRAQVIIIYNNIQDTFRATGVTLGLGEEVFNASSTMLDGGGQDGQHYGDALATMHKNVVVAILCTVLIGTLPTLIASGYFY